MFGIRLVKSADCLEEMAEQGRQILTRLNQAKTMMQTIHEALDEAENEVAKDVDLIVKKLAQQKANSAEKSQNGDATNAAEQQKQADLDAQTQLSNGNIISGLPKHSQKYQNMRLRLVDQNKSELFMKLQHYAKCIPSFLDLFN